MKNKKGITLQEAPLVIMMLLVIAVLVIISFVVFSSVGTSVKYTANTYNESGFINGTGDRLGNATDCGFVVPTTIIVYNTSNFISSGNYTIDENGTVRNTTSKVYPAVNFTYTYQNSGPGCTASQNTITNFTGYPALIGLVGTIIFLGIVVGVLVYSFMGRAKKP